MKSGALFRGIFSKRKKIKEAQSQISFVLSILIKKIQLMT